MHVSQSKVPFKSITKHLITQGDVLRESQLLKQPPPTTQPADGCLMYKALSKLVM